MPKGPKAAEQKRRDKVELEYAAKLPLLWSRFPRVDSDTVRTVWEQAADIDEAVAMLRTLHASSSSSSVSASRATGRSNSTGPCAAPWACTRCTLVNEPSARACAACDSARGAPPLAEAGATEREAAPAGAAAAASAPRPALTGLDASFMRALPHDALVGVLSLLSYDDTVRLGSTCRELRELAGVVPVRHVRLGSRQRSWPDRRVLGLLRHISELERVSISAALSFHSFGALAALPRAPSLLALSLSSPLLVDAHLEGWADAFTALRELRLSGCALTPRCVPSLLLFGRRAAPATQQPQPPGGEGPGLTLLDLSANHALDTAAVSALLGGLRTLGCLDVSRLPRLESGLLNCQMAPSVRELLLKGFCAPSAPLLSRWVRLEALSLQESALVQLAVALPRLRSLSLAGSRALAHLELRCAALCALDLASCARLEMVAAHAETRAIASLNLAMCRRLDGHAVAALVAQCAPALARANLNGLTRMRDEPPVAWLRTAAALRERMGRRLRFVDLRGSCAAGHTEAFFSAAVVEAGGRGS